MITSTSASQSFFEAMYQKDEDPWGFATSDYERGRYASIISALHGRRYKHAFEPGCSVGVLTEQLARICDRVDAMDISSAAIAQAQNRTGHLSNVSTTCGALPDFIPSGNFDLIVFSEIGYYFSEGDLFAVAKALVDRSCRNSTVLVTHWLGESPDHLLSGDRVHEIIAQISNLSLQHSERHVRFRLDVWTKR